MPDDLEEYVDFFKGILPAQTGAYGASLQRAEPLMSAGRAVQTAAYGNLSGVQTVCSLRRGKSVADVEADNADAAGGLLRRVERDRGD